MPEVAVATGSGIAAEAGALMANEGGNAVDAALAAAMVTMCTDLGIMAPGCGGFVTIWPPGADPVVIDGYAEMPGRAADAPDFRDALREASFDYGGMMLSQVGYGSIATPGAFAAFAAAAERYGSQPWRRIMHPAVDWVDRGFPVSPNAAEYLSFTHEAIFSWHPETQRALHHADGRPLAEGDTVRLPEFADSLHLLAEQGVGALYGGELGRRIATDLRANGSALGLDDLASYRAEVRQPIVARLGDWSVATVPPPAVGGACLAAMLTLLERGEHEELPAEVVASLVRVQHAVLDYRARRLDGAHERLPEVVEALLQAAGLGDPQALLSSPSTMHISAVDDTGLACSITASAGYGSGVTVPGTGMLLNNSLGEVELHPEGLKGLPPGTRLSSNMAPTVARRTDGAVLAVGSPGASRITTAIAQALWHHVGHGLPLTEAISHPRLHVELFPESRYIAHEPGLSVQPMDGLTPRGFAAPDMYFGAVNAVQWHPDAGLEAVADARRGGSTSRGGHAA